MKKRASTVLAGCVAAVGLLVAVPAKADHVSFGFGVSNGEGGYFSFGLSNGGGGRHGGGHGYSGHGYARHCGPGPILCAPVPVYCAPRPPVVYVPQPVAYARPVQTVVVNSGYWLEREQRVWVEGGWVESVDAYGRRCKTWQPGRWEIRRTREWVQ